jgi:hypothetical protein
MSNGRQDEGFGRRTAQSASIATWTSDVHLATGDGGTATGKSKAIEARAPRRGTGFVAGCVGQDADVT